MKLYKNSFVIFYLVMFLLIVAIYFIWITKFGPIIFLSENQTLYTFSASAQVIAGIFGLTVAGFVFLNDSLDKRFNEDETLEESVKELKNKYKQNIVLMSIVSFVSISISILSIIFYETTYGFYNHQININIILVLMNVAIIINFVFQIIDPNKIEKISSEQKKIIDSNEVEENEYFSEFMKNFNYIENILKNYAKEMRLYKNYYDNKENYKKYTISNSKIASTLLQNELIRNDDFENLLTIIKYRNSLVHSNDLKVSKKMLERTEKMKEKFKENLNSYYVDENHNNF